MKNLNDLRGVQDLRSMHSAGKSAIPRTRASAFMQLHTLQREKERLEQTAKNIQKNEGRVSRRLAEIEKAMAGLLQADKPIASSEKKSKKVPVFY